MKQPKGAIFAQVSFTFRTRRFAEAYVKRCKAADMTAFLAREHSRRGWHIVNVWIYRGEELPAH